MIDGIKEFENIKLPFDKSSRYGDVDGISLQNLFYAKNGYFPGCYLFDYESRTNGDYKFDTKKIAKYLLEHTDKDENVEFIDKGGFFSKVDLGIVRYHFEVGSGRSFEWR